MQRVEDWDYNFLPLPAGGIPSEIFADALDLKLNGASLELKRYGPAHTDSDISVTFGEADIVHVGDTFWNGVYPFIDYSTGGSIDGTIAACDANLAAATAETIIIAGHGQPVSNKSELQEFRDMLVGVRENVATLKRQGRTRDEIVAAKPTAAYDAKFGAFVIDPASSRGLSTKASERPLPKPARPALPRGNLPATLSPDKRIGSHCLLFVKRQRGHVNSKHGRWLRVWVVRVSDGLFRSPRHGAWPSECSSRSPPKPDKNRPS